MVNPVRVGVVGAGYWGPKLVRNFAEIPSAALTMVVDRDAERLERIAEHYPDVLTSPRFADLLDSDAEAVVIATPIRSHFALAKAALMRGKHVLVEKPLAGSSAEAEELCWLAERRGLVLMVGHTFEYNPAVRMLRDIVASGEIGELYYVDAARLNLGLFRTDVNVLWDLAPHDLSILLYVLQLDPISITARGSACVNRSVHDVVYMEAHFPGDLQAHLHVSWLDPCKVRRVTIVGSKKMVVYNDVVDDEKIRIYDKGVDRPYETDRFQDFHLCYRYGEMETPPVPFDEPLRLQCEHFVESIRTGGRPLSDGWSGLKVVRILEQADRSLQNGGLREPIVLGEQRVNRRPLGSLSLAQLAAGLVHGL